MAQRISRKVIDSIRKLRQKGFSLNEIRKLYPIGYGSLYRYIKDVEMFPEYKKTWLGKRGGSIKRKKLAEKIALREAKKVIKNLSYNEKLLFITALYWGEGNKKDFGLTNSDPELIRIFIHGLLNLLRVEKNRIRVSIRIFEDMNKKKCLEYWSKITGIPFGEFANVNILKGKKKGKLLYGMCRIRVLKGGNMLKYMVALRLVVAEKFYPRSSTDRTEVS